MEDFTGGGESRRPAELRAAVMEDLGTTGLGFEAERSGTGARGKGERAAVWIRT